MRFLRRHRKQDPAPKQPILLSEYLEQRGVDLASLPVVEAPPEIKVVPRSRPKPRYAPIRLGTEKQMSRWILYRRLDGMTWAEILVERNTMSPKTTLSGLYACLRAEDRGLLRQLMFWKGNPSPSGTPENFYWHERGFTDL